MSISSEISRIQGNVADAYTALSVKGATMPSLRNTANLKSTIESIEMMVAEAMSIETIRAICVVLSDFEKNYTALQYIESSGTQYIDTGLAPNQDTRVVMDLKVSDSHSGEGHLCSARSTTSGPFWILYYNNSKYTTRYGTQSGTAFTTADRNRHIFDKNKNVTSIDGETIQKNYETFAVSSNLPLLCRLTGTTTDGFLSAKLYSCQIYDNGTLVRDYVPCIRNSDGAVGLYDKVNERFYGNAGSGSFTGA